MSEDSPYLSVVVVSRNDDHGGNPLQRTQLCINSFYEQCNRYELSAELIVIDWNPPSDRPGLGEVIHWPEDRRFIKSRVITVPPEFHRSLAHSDNLPLFQMIGKNVGIRRARGEYVLATNIDILFSEELMEYLSKKPLQHGHSYRVDRFDVDSDVMKKPLIDVMKYTNDHVIRYNIKLGTFFKSWVGKNGSIINLFSYAAMFFIGNRVMVFIINLFWRLLNIIKQGVRIIIHTLQHILREGFLGGITGGFYDDFCDSIRKICLLIKSRLLRRPHVYPERESSFLMLVTSFLYRLKTYADYGLPFIHLNGCGDFTLLSKEDWNTLGGYYEEAIFSWNVDSLFLIDAYYCGIKEIYLQPPKNIFHVEHGAGSGWTPGKGEQLLFDRLEKAGTPYFSWEDSLKYSHRWCGAKDKQQLLRSIKKMNYGFPKLTLLERFIE